jgi:asparagine synthase (glutamine-hydrolysing)
MCGIFGWVSYHKGLGPEELSRARAATDLLRHRGPDNQGEWYDEQVFMGHRRLNIIDLSSAANQPFEDPSRRYVLTFNGEIYNYIEVRADLERLGFTFHTSSDTEVLLTALIHWGLDALKRCDGMYAAAFHDRKTGEHLLLRDPLGQKPLYYRTTDDGVLYASELRSLLSLPQFSWKIDRVAFARYLMQSYYGWDETPIVGVRKLLPGSCLRASRNGVRIERYWDSLPGDCELAVGEDEAVAEFSRLFGESCTRSMRSDVPCGIFLSGGIDSSLVLSFCREANHDIRSVAVGMSEPDYDESGKAETVSNHLGIAHHRMFVMDPQAIDESLTAVFNTIDEPHADPGFVNAHFLARRARELMIVALAGDGGDELFAGYAPFAGLRAASVMRHCPGVMLWLMQSAASAIPANDRYLGLQFKVLAFLQGFPASDAIRFPLWLSAVGLADLRRLCPLLPADFFSHRGEPGSLFGYVEELMGPMRGHTLQQQLLYYYQKVFLPEFVCAHTDRASMQSSLEVRSPFLSLPLIEFANRLPERLKTQRDTLKLLLRKAAARRGFPPEIVGQAKQGFTLPLARWLKSSLRPRAEALLLTDDWTEGLIDRSVVRSFFEEHLADKRNNYRLLYALMVFCAWRQRYPQLQVA